MNFNPEDYSIPEPLKFTGTTGRSATNNNPLNLEYRPGSYQDKYGAALEPPPKSGSRQRFAIFPNMEAGYMAGIEQIKIDQNRGHTLASFVEKFAPSHENPTTELINQYASKLGVSPDTPLSQIPAEKLIIPMLARESSTKIADDAGVLKNIGNIIGPKQAEAATGPTEQFNPADYSIEAPANFNPEDYSLQKPSGIYAAPEPDTFTHIFDKLSDYLGFAGTAQDIPYKTAAQIEVEAKDRGLTVPEYKRELTDTNRTEFANILMRYASARTLGLTDAIEKFINGDLQLPKTATGTFAGAGAGLFGFIQSPYTIAKAITGTRFIPTSQGLRGVTQLMTHGAANLGAASMISSVIPSLLDNEKFSEATLETIKSGGMGALVGAAFPLTGYVPTKPLQIAMGVAGMDMLRALGKDKGLFTLDDLYRGIQDGTIDRKELAKQSFDLLMDIYFIAKTPSMKKQLAEIAERNPVVAEILKVNAEEAEQSIMEITGQRQPPLEKPEAAKGKTEEPIFKPFTQATWNEAIKKFNQGIESGEIKPFFEVVQEVSNEKQLKILSKGIEKIEPILTPAPLEIVQPAETGEVVPVTKKKSVYDLTKAEERYDRETIIKSFGKFNSRADILKNYTPEERRRLFPFTRKGAQYPDELLQELKGNYPDMFGEFDTDADLLTAILDGKLKPRDRDLLQEYYDAEITREAQARGVGEESLREIEAIAEREIAAERDALQGEDFLVPLKPPKPSEITARLDILEADYPGIDRDKVATVIRALPNAEDGQIVNMAADPKMFAQVARGNLAASEKAKLRFEGMEAPRKLFSIQEMTPKFLEKIPGLPAEQGNQLYGIFDRAIDIAIKGGDAKKGMIRGADYETISRMIDRVQEVLQLRGGLKPGESWEFGRAVNKELRRRVIESYGLQEKIGRYEKLSAEGDLRALLDENRVPLYDHTKATGSPGLGYAIDAIDDLVFSTRGDAPEIHGSYYNPEGNLVVVLKGKPPEAEIKGIIAQIGRDRLAGHSFGFNPAYQSEGKPYGLPEHKEGDFAIELQHYKGEFQHGRKDFTPQEPITIDEFKQALGKTNAGTRLGIEDVGVKKMYSGGPATPPIIKAVIEDTAKIVRETPSAFRNALETTRELGKELWEWYKSPVERKQREYKSIIKKYIGDVQIAGYTNQEFLKYIQVAIPDIAKRHGITNWIQAGGDETILKYRADNAKWAHKPGYEAALNLTPGEKAIAIEVIRRYDQYLQEAQAAGIMRDGVENYVNGLWRRGKDNKQELQKLRATANAGLLDTDFQYARKKIFKDYFEGEQAGKTPINKDIAFLLGHYHQSMYEAIAARKAIAALIKGKADDGNPIVSPGGYGKRILDAEGKTDAYLIKGTPKDRSEDGRPYVNLNYPSLRKWKWVEKDADGNSIYYEGDLWVHPDVAPDLRNVLGKSAIREYAIGRAALAVSQSLKQVLLSGIPTPFHQVHVGSHAIFHKINPFTTPPINFNDPKQRFGVESGLLVFNHNALADFSEGLLAGGIAYNIPGIGRVSQAYGEYLFMDLIPRYKMKLFIEAFKRNQEIYKDKYNKEEIGEITANQANAAFGELNYKAMGRNPTLQDVFRLSALAPDFLEARLRFAGQAVRPGGREQATALIRGMAILYGMGVVANMLLSDDHDPHWDKPFQLVIGDTSYSLRSVPGDIQHLITNPNSFALHRLNPVTTRTLLEMTTQRDVFGRKRDFRDQVGDFFRSITPIPLQGAVSEKEQSLLQSFLRTLGVTSWKAKDAADRYLSDFIADNRRDLSPAMRRKEVFKKEFDKLAEDYLTGKTPAKYQKLMDFVRSRTEEEQELLDKRFGILMKVHGIKEREFFRQLPHVPPDVRAKAFTMKYYDANPEKRKYLLQKANELPGIVTDKFNAELQKIIDERNQANQGARP